MQTKNVIEKIKRKPKHSELFQDKSKIHNKKRNKYLSRQEKLERVPELVF